MDNELDLALAGLSGSDLELGARVCDVADKVLTLNEPASTDFLDPHEQEVARKVASRLPNLVYRFFGGYRGSERARLTLFPDFYLTETFQPPVAALFLKPGNPDSLTHRDYLGALVGLGLRREKVGDLILTGEGCQVLVTSEVVDVVLAGLQQVGGQSVAVSEMDVEQLQVPGGEKKELSVTVASLRLDAVASAGFGMSRSKMAREIKAEKVKVNWQPVNNPSYAVNSGDIISMRGRGRVVVGEVAGTTRKGRLRLSLERYTLG